MFLELVQEHRIATGMLATPMLLFLVDYPETDRYDTDSLPMSASGKILKFELPTRFGKPDRSGP